jgi:polysaccharide biosynthesis transport protein
MNGFGKSFVSALSRHGIPALAAFSATIGSALFYLSKTPPQYESATRLIVDDRSVSISPLGQNLADLQNKPPGGANPLATQAELVTSQRVMERAIERLQPKLDRLGKTLTTHDLNGKVKVSIVPATNILEIKYRNDEPRLTKLVLDALAEAMVSESAIAIRSEALAVREFLEREVPEQQARLEQTEAAENQYRQQSRLVSPEDQTRNLVNSLTETENQERALTAELQASYTRSQALQGVTQSQSLAAAYGAVRAGQNPTLITLQAKLTDLETQVVEARSRLGDQHPDLLALTQQRDETRSLYNQQIQSLLAQAPPSSLATDQLSQTLIADYITGEVERLALENQLQSIQVAKLDLQNRIQQIPVQQQPLMTLIRKRQEAANTLEILRGKLEEARVAEAQLVSNIRVIDFAWEPTSASWPKPLPVLLLATTAGSILAAGVILLLEQLDGTVHPTFDAAEILHLPILGVLPKLSKPELALQDLTPFLHTPGRVEPYQMFLKTLTLRTPKTLGLVTISSAAVNEGKSTIAAHLATVAALSRRTLLIDADLRRPSQDLHFGVHQYPGLTDVLCRRLPLSEAVQSTALPNLSILTHGSPAPHPMAVFESGQLAQLLRDARDRYDLVIIDTPPISFCAESTTIAQHSDALVLVVRPHLTLKDKLQHLVTELTQNGLPLVGIAVNGAKRSLDRYYWTQVPVPETEAQLQEPTVAPFIQSGRK